MTLSGIPEGEQERVAGVTHGQYWMTVRDGVLVFSPTRDPLPSPTEDAEMLPFWRRHKEGQVRLESVDFDSREIFSPSFMIKHLCGYHYTPENYIKNAKILESYGFLCMRSQRGDDGMFWEVWYLPGTWQAKGELKKFLDEERRKKQTSKDQKGYFCITDKKEETDSVVSFLCRNVSFGQLDVVAQRAAMVID